MLNAIVRARARAASCSVMTFNCDVSSDHGPCLADVPAARATMRYLYRTAEDRAPLDDRKSRGARGRGEGVNVGKKKLDRANPRSGSTNVTVAIAIATNRIARDCFVSVAPRRALTDDG